MSLIDFAKSLAIPDIEDEKHAFCSSKTRIGAELFGYGSPKFGEETVICAGYETGGASGGNCWGDSAQSYSTSHNGVELRLLDELLKVAAPGISFLQYKELTSLIESDTHTEYEYYGNHTDYTYLYLPLALVEHKLREWGYL